MTELIPLHDIEGKNIPSPSPEIYRRAAELVDVCGYIPGDLIDTFDVVENGVPRVKPSPCCLNGHLMLAIGTRPDYDLYDNEAYQVIAHQVLSTLRNTHESHTSHLRSLSGEKGTEWAPSRIESWNDQLPRELGYTSYDVTDASLSPDEASKRQLAALKAVQDIERQVLLATAERLEQENK